MWLSPWSAGLCVYMALRSGYHHEVQGYVFTWPWGVAITMKCRAMCLHGPEVWLSPWSAGLCVYMALRCGYHHEVQGYVFTFYSLYYFFLLSTLCPHFFPSKTKSCHSIYMYTVDNRNWGSVWIVIFGSHIKTSSMAIRRGGGGGVGVRVCNDAILGNFYFQL